jgi:hypothetical protein
METKYFVHFSKQHLEPITEQMDCCICLNPSDNQTKKCSHPMCIECFYKLTDNKTKNIPCPICRKVLVKRRRTNNNKILNDLHLYQLIQEEVDRHLSNTNLPRFIPASVILGMGNSNRDVRTENFSPTSTLEMDNPIRTLLENQPDLARRNGFIPSWASASVNVRFNGMVHESFI